MDKADVIIIGSGQGGVPLATSLAQEGRDVVLFERSKLGGSCVNYGCTPSKTFLASAHLAGLAPYARELGIQADISVDFPAVMDRVRGMINVSNSGVEQSLEDSGVRIINAEAAFTAPRTVAGNGHTVQAPLVIVNTGKSPNVLDIPGLKDSPYLTYESFWQLTELPPRTIVLGGGYVGLELGQGLARLGSQVHMIEKSDRIVTREESDVSEALSAALEQDGVRFHYEQKAEQVAYQNGLFQVKLSNGQQLEGEAFLVATGRKANTAGLNAEAGGLELDDRGHIETNDRFQTSSDGVYAIGDVTGQPAFTHVSWEDYRRLQAILGGDDRRRGDRVLAYAFFTTPQVGRAGLTLEQAEAEGYQARAVTHELEGVDRARETGRTLGFYRMVVDEQTDRILGATLVGATAAELIHVFIAHMEAGSSWQRLEQSIHIHPTFAEGLTSLARRLK